MKKKLLLIIFLLIGIISFSQQNEKFVPGVNLIENTIVSEIKSQSSVLFVFKGDTHFINFYRDLSKKLKKQFRKSKQKIKFNYELSSEKPLESDLKSLPKKTFEKENFDVICYVSTTFIKGWDNHIIKERKQNYDMNLQIVNSGTNVMMESAKININSFYTTLTQNINSSKLIYILINE
ncbi:hypothetical protein ES692_17625 [Psychroserpens burtonensis]|uniref:Uncharacterized protein n=1 Tax=Psychroserpens burtonensis TaxID=49278 RepID=A0A5C7B399_9FLAO|nr:hypothetical protein [Psychroserpens burtonensis]TXE14907.1 hypothetical protein ES692_17625 [Psychroserpens burtonensis]